MANRASLLATLAVIRAFTATAAESPNVLIIVADDHAAYVTGAYGNRIVRTPNLDRLASEGMRFDRAYCNAPVCTASRASFITGRYPRSIGVTQLKTALPDNATTLAEVMSESGYATAAFGKMHFNSDLTHGFDVLIDTPDHAAMLQTRGALPLPDGGPTLGRWQPFKEPAREWLNSMNWPYAAVEENMPSRYLADEAAKFISAQRDGSFFCIVSFYEPHSPFRYPVEFRGRHSPSEFDPPDPGPEDDWQIPTVFRSLTREEKQGITAAYYTSVEYMDSSVGRLLAALDESGHADDTIVIFLGDHGYFLGHHGRFEKHAMYEEAVRVPFLVRYPGEVQPATSSNALIELVDLFPTVTDLCGVITRDPIDGRSLRPVLDGSHGDHREYVFVEYSENAEGMVRDGRWKLVYGAGNRVRDDGYATRNPTPGRYVLLFDTLNDPAEQKNLAGDPAHTDRVRHMIRLLRTHFESTTREPESLPTGADDYTMLDFCLQPRDVTKENVTP